ncbi:hypothetical protein ACFLTR_02915 [Chloroflexota bacterium]
MTTKSESCTGCRTCELLCSLNKTGELNPYRNNQQSYVPDEKAKKLSYLIYLEKMARTGFSCSPGCAWGCDSGYRWHGWDKETSLQMRRKLTELDMEDVADVLQREGALSEDAVPL